MQCPITSGKADKGDGHPIDLTGATLKIQLTLTKLPQPSITIKDTSSVPGSGDAQPTGLVPNTASTDDNPAVTVMSITPTSMRNPFLFLFDDWFNANLKDFNQCFFAAVLNTKAANSSLQWLKPTTISYAVADSEGGTSVFGALCETDGDSSSALASQIDPGILTGMPQSANSVLAISGEKVTEHILKYGAQQVLQGSQLADFDIVGDGLVVQNNKDLTWMSMTLQDKTVVSPVIPKGNFRMRVVQDTFELEFTGLTWKHPLMVGNNIFTLSFTQYMHVELHQKTDGSFVLFPTNKDPANPNSKELPDLRQMSIQVTPDADAQSFEKTMSYIAIVASVLPLGLSVFKAGSWAIRTGSAAAQAGGEVINVAADAAELAPLVEDSLVATDNLAAAAALTRGSTAAASAELSTLINRFATGLGLISAVTGGLAAGIKLQENGDLDVTDVPSIDNFIANVLACTQWHQDQTWGLKDVRLAQSLLLFGQLSKS
jgi:hypothetical protein